MYTFDSRIRYSETGEDKKLTLEGLLNYFQDCSTFQSQDIGRGVEVLEANHFAWVMSFYQVCINRLPKFGETVCTGTKAYEFRGFLGGRNFQMTTQDGEVLAYANTLWTFLDMQKGIPVRVPREEAEAYPLEEKLDMEYAPRKIRLPETLEERQAFSVMRHHLDTNHHVNHVQYICMAQEFLPADFAVKEVRAEYKMQARLQDVIYPSVAFEDGVYYVALCNEERKPYAIVRFQ